MKPYLIPLLLILQVENDDNSSNHSRIYGYCKPEPRILYNHIEQDFDSHHQKHYHIEQKE